MLIDEMFEHILVRSGHFLLGANKIELDRDKFANLVKGALGIYSLYKPVDVTFNLHMQTARSFKFTDEFVPHGMNDKYGIPRFISSVTPTAIIGSPAFALMGQFGTKLGWSHTVGISNSNNYTIPGQTQVESDQMEKSQFPWVWRKPTLYIPYSADVEICAVWEHKLFEVPATAQDKASWRCDTIEYSDDKFFDIIEGMFLMALGQSRRAFTMNDLPIISDADTIASTGKDLKDMAVEDLRVNKMKFYLAYGD